MGLTISGTVNIERPMFFSKYASMGSVIAFIKAVVDRSLLEPFADLQKLKAIYPDRVNFIGKQVSLSGPVMIIPNRAALLVMKAALPLLLGATISLTCFFLAKAIIDKQFERRPVTPTVVKQEEKVKKYSLIGSVVTGVLAAAITAFVAQRNLPAVPGIYFY